MTDTTAFVVVDTWRVKPGKRDETRAVLARAAREFRDRPGVLSVDFAQLDDDPDRYLVVFRYVNREARESFRANPGLQATMARLSGLWDLEGSVMLGEQSGL